MQCKYTASSKIFGIRLTEKHVKELKVKQCNEWIQMAILEDNFNSMEVFSNI